MPGRIRTGRRPAPAAALLRHAPAFTDNDSGPTRYAHAHDELVAGEKAAEPAEP